MREIQKEHLDDILQKFEERLDDMLLDIYKLQSDYTYCYINNILGKIEMLADSIKIIIRDVRQDKNIPKYRKSKRRFWE